MDESTECRCALDKSLREHRDTCPLYPGQPLRVAGATLLAMLEDT
jgi:hypothetical protein